MFSARTCVSKLFIFSALLVVLLLALGGCTGEGPAIEARSQSISFSPIQTPAVNQVTVTASATASSGLPVKYTSLTPSICSVDSSSGVVAGIASGTCTIAANQSGNDHFAPAPQVTQNVNFNVTAANSNGTSPPAPLTDIVTTYKVITTFYEPDTQPNNSIFIGTFDLNATTGAVTNLKGKLSESMTGGSIPYPNDTMTWLSLNNQLSSVSDGQGGVLVTTFLKSTTETFTNNPVFGGTDGWSPGTGSALYYGYPMATTGIANPGNAYVRIFVNTAAPTSSLTQAQIEKLAYADCASGGMMGATCMTGTTIAGYGTVGTMSGYPASQTITKQ